MAQRYYYRSPEAARLSSSGSEWLNSSNATQLRSSVYGVEAGGAGLHVRNGPGATPRSAARSGEGNSCSRSQGSETKMFRRLLQQERKKRKKEAAISQRVMEEVEARLERALGHNKLLSADVEDQIAAKGRLEQEVEDLRERLDVYARMIRYLSTELEQEKATQSAREDTLWSSIVNARQADFMRTWASCREEDVEVLSPIGAGGFGIVAPLVARDARQQALVDVVTGGRGLVVKTIRDPDDAVSADSLRREIVLFRKFFPPTCHGNVIDLFSVDAVKPAIVAERMHTDLARVFKSGEWREVSVTMKTRVLSQAVMGILQMHGQGVVHGDVKAANFLATEDLSVVKVTDLGLAGVIGSPVNGGSLGSICPENSFIYRGSGSGDDSCPLTPAGDVYGLGHLVLEGISSRGELLTEKFLRGKGFQRAGGKELFGAACARCDQLFMRTLMFPHVGSYDCDWEYAERKLESAVFAQVAMFAKMNTEFLLSPDAWPEQGALPYKDEVKLVLSSALHPNPHRRLSAQQMWDLLQIPALWSANFEWIEMLSDFDDARCWRLVEEMTNILRPERDEPPAWYASGSEERWWEVEFPVSALYRPPHE